LEKFKINKIILIAPHKFSESPHAKGKLIFQDYYDHFVKTLEFLNKTNIKKVLWIFRQHPSSKDFNEQGIIKKFLKNEKNNFIRACPKNISSENLAEICDHVITCRGTIGLEFASKGKKPIITGNAVYSGNNFVLQSHSQKKYFNYLKNINKIKQLSKQDTLRAKKLLYFLENYKVDLRESQIIPDELQSFKVRKNFFKYVNNNIKKTKIKSDIYYTDLKQKIETIYK